MCLDRCKARGGKLFFDRRYIVCWKRLPLRVEKLDV